MARQIAERVSWVWTDKGVKPSALSDAAYSGGEQPVSEFDNAWNYGVSKDIETLKGEVAEHVGRHEAGGPDEVDLRGLSLADVATFRKPAPNRAVVTAGTGDDRDPLIGFNTEADSESVTELAPVTTQLTTRGGIRAEDGGVELTGEDVTAGDGETTVYDNSEQEVPQAQLGGPAAHLTDYPLPVDDDLSEHTITIETSGALDGGSEVALGGTIELEATSSGDVSADDLSTNWFDVEEGGVVLGGDVAYILTTALEPGETLNVYQGRLVANDLGPVPSGIDLVVGRRAGANTVEHVETVIAGDGSTTFSDVTGNGPLVTHTNRTDSTTDIFVGVDNGDSDIGIGGSGAEREVQGGVIAHTSGGS